MSENLLLYTKALYGLQHVTRLAPTDAWDKASPCDGWTGRHVLGHVNAIQRYIEATIASAPPPMNPMEDPDRHAGTDPAATWAATLDDLLTALDRPDVLHREVDSFWGTIAVDQMIGFNIADTTVHTWDLARAVGVDDRLDPVLVERALALLAPAIDGMRDSGMVGPATELPEGADPQARLLALMGRQP